MIIIGTTRLTAKIRDSRLFVYRRGWITFILVWRLCWPFCSLMSSARPSGTMTSKEHSPGPARTPAPPVDEKKGFCLRMFFRRSQLGICEKPSIEEAETYRPGWHLHKSAILGELFYRKNGKLRRKLLFCLPLSPDYDHGTKLIFFFLVSYILLPLTSFVSLSSSH